MNRILVIGDLHEPATHPKYLQFCKDLYDEWRCNKVIMIGDAVDWQAISVHDKHPDLPSAGKEYELIQEAIKPWYEAFPHAVITEGNHDLRPFRLGKTVNLSDRLIKDQNTLWNTPKWTWIPEIVVDEVYYYHGMGVSSLYPAFNKARSMGMSVVSGHVHSAAGVWWAASPRGRFFGMNVGCGVDIDKLQFEYGIYHIRRPILAAGIVLGSIPYLEIMPCAQGEKYYKG